MTLPESTAEVPLVDSRSEYVEVGTPMRPPRHMPNVVARRATLHGRTGKRCAEARANRITGVAIGDALVLGLLSRQNGRVCQVSTQGRGGRGPTRRRRPSRGCASRASRRPRAYLDPWEARTALVQAL